MKQEKKEEETFKEFVPKAKFKGHLGYFGADSLFANLLINPISLTLTYLIKKIKKKITPEQVMYFPKSRIFFFAPLILASLILVPLLNNSSFYLYAAILFYLLLLTDFMDGQLARGMNAKSGAGAFLDSVGDTFGTPIFFVLCFSVGLWLDNNFLLIGSILAFAFRSFPLTLMNMVFHYKETKNINKGVLESFSGKKDKRALGIEQTMSFINKILGFFIKGTKGIAHFERQLIVVILPCLLLFFGLINIAKPILYFFLIVYCLFFLLRIRTILKQAQKFFE